jgi:YD repeat-containing protein
LLSSVRPVVTAIFSLLSFAALSQGVTHYQEPGIAAGREYVKQHFAERIDPFSGNLSLQFVDLVIPGNGGFDLKVQRSYNANAAGEIKSPFGRGWQIHFGRVTHLANQLCAGASARSLAIQLPDGSSQVLYKSNGIGGTSSSLDYLSASWWKARCNSAEAGMTVTSPDGTKYDMTEVDGVYWHAKRITDRFGNYFDITYVTNGTAGKKVVSQVMANDGRSLNFSYSGDKLTSIEGGGNTWGYTVSAAADASNQLTQVSRPAGGNWSYSYNGNTGDAKSWLLTSMTNPYGGAVTYTYQLVQFMPGVVGGPPSLPAVNTKVADGKQWQYGFSPGCASSGMDTTTVTQPDSIGQLIYKHHGHCSISQGEVWKIGLLQEKKSGTVQTETYTWTPLVFSNESTARPGYFTQDLQINRPLMASRTVARDGINYTTTNGSFDAFGNPQSIAENGTRSRNRTASYYNNVTSWIIGLIDDEGYTNVGSITRSRDSSTGALLSESRFGVTTAYTYHSDGSVASMQTDKPATTTYSNYSRGVAQTENRPAGVAISRTVDSAGNVKTETDGQFTWGYDYDGIGRLTSINYPAGSDATITWDSSSRALTRGTYSETTQFDSFGRTTSVTRGGIAQLFGFDALGRETFRSMPGSALGTTKTLDVLGRVKTEVAPAGQKTYTYTSGDVSVNNERGYSTFYEFDRYGDPDEGFLVGIAAPETSASVDMVRNQVGVLTSATQGGVTRTYGRDTRFFLTSISEPETTGTTFGRDGVGNMTSKTVGGQTVTYGYDGLNRLESISGPSVSVTIGYNNRSKVTTVTNGSALRTYSYDTNGNLTEDRLSVDGQLFVVGYGYDAIDGLASITYPMSKGTVTYSPNALGRPTQASPFASSVGHYPSGNLSSISYANGVFQSFGENSRQLPSSISASGVVGLTYGYDNGGNITSIVDSIAAETRTLNYDAIDRLTVWNSPDSPDSLLRCTGLRIDFQTPLG